MAELRVYADATALTGLVRIKWLDLLTLFPCPVCVTARIWDEVAGGPERPGERLLRAAVNERLLAIVDEGDPHAFPELDPGEATVVSAAAAVRGAVIIDERKARALIGRNVQLRSSIRQAIGVVGLILLAKRRGHIDAVLPLLDDLTTQGFWISPALRRDALEEAGEDGGLTEM